MTNKQTTPLPQRVVLRASGGVLMLLRRGCNQDVCAAVSLTLHVVTCGSDPDSCVGDCGVLPVAVGQMCLTLFFFPECLAD